MLTAKDALACFKHHLKPAVTLLGFKSSGPAAKFVRLEGQKYRVLEFRQTVPVVTAWSGSQIQGRFFLRTDPRWEDAESFDAITDIGSLFDEDSWREYAAINNKIRSVKWSGAPDGPLFNDKSSENRYYYSRFQPVKARRKSEPILFDVMTSRDVESWAAFLAPRLAALTDSHVARFPSCLDDGLDAQSAPSNGASSS